MYVVMGYEYTDARTETVDWVPSPSNNASSFCTEFGTASSFFDLPTVRNASCRLVSVYARSYRCDKRTTIYRCFFLILFSFSFVASCRVVSV